mmetsp:Transcript_20484/g.42967  ORF Transcript_20484/g.42967 Transcript_20484/m.42967 type:complete len:327 (+) Transcript_20484:81-1061(+)
MMSYSFNEKDAEITANINYINPDVAPVRPEIPLPRGLGEEVQNNQKKPYAVSVPQRIRDGRLHGQQKMCLERDGFELLTNVSMPIIRNNPRKRYYAARSVFGKLAMKLVEERYPGSGAFASHFFPPIYRSADTSGQGKGLADHKSSKAPHAMAHNDYGFGYEEYLRRSPNPMNFRDPKKCREFSNNLAHADRFITLQFWIPYQPHGTVIENDALAMCKTDSIKLSDLVTRPILSYGGEKLDPGYTILQAKPSSMHKWYYFPNMISGKEGLVFCGYDSSWKHNLKPCFHSSIHLEEKEGGRPRESLECRVMVFCKSCPIESPPRSRL